MKKVLVSVTVLAMFLITTCASMSIVSVEWDTLEGPSKTRQFVGFSNYEIKIYAVYKDESRKQTNPGLFNWTIKYDKDKIGVQTVSVSYGGTEGSFQTEVMPLQSIRIEKQPSKTSYTVGEKADLAGIKVMGSWKDMPDAEIPSYSLTATGFNSSTAGNKSITVDFKGKTASYPVVVTVPVAPEPAPAAVASTPAPAASAPSTQQSSQVTIPRAIQTGKYAGHPLIGTWKSETTTGEYDGKNYVVFDYWAFNADGTRPVVSSINGELSNMTNVAKWSVSGNVVTVDLPFGNSIYTYNYSYSISGNKLTWTALDSADKTPKTFTKQ